MLEFEEVAGLAPLPLEWKRERHAKNTRGNSTKSSISKQQVHTGSTTVAV